MDRSEVDKIKRKLEIRTMRKLILHRVSPPLTFLTFKPHEDNEFYYPSFNGNFSGGGKNNPPRARGRYSPLPLVQFTDSLIKHLKRTKSVTLKITMYYFKILT